MTTKAPRSKRSVSLVQLIGVGSEESEAKHNNNARITQLALWARTAGLAVWYAGSASSYTRRSRAVRTCARSKRSMRMPRVTPPDEY